MPDRVNRTGFPMGHKFLERGAAYYDAVYLSGDYVEKMKRPWNKQPARLVTWYPALMLTEGSIFEVGCGCGHLAQMCAEYGVDYSGGFDFSKEAIKIARLNTPGSGFALADARTARAEGLIRSAQYDTLVALEVLEHVWADLDLVEAIPAGRVFVASVPDFQTEGHVRWFSKKQQVRARYGSLLHIDKVVEEVGVNSDNRWFTFRGVRKDD